MRRMKVDCKDGKGGVQQFALSSVRSTSGPRNPLSVRRTYAQRGGTLFRAGSGGTGARITSCMRVDVNGVALSSSPPSPVRPSRSLLRPRSLQSVSWFELARHESTRSSTHTRFSPRKASMEGVSLFSSVPHSVRFPFSSAPGWPRRAHPGLLQSRHFGTVARFRTLTRTATHL